MEAPCVQVSRDRGEAVRRQLAALDAIDETYRISSDEEWVYIPVDSAADLPGKYDVVTRPVDPRDSQTLPQDLLDEPPGYERLGEIALIDEDDPERASAIANALMEADLPVKTVLNRASKIAGEYRVREWELLAGEETETVHREFGAEFLVDVTEVYFSPRLATERHRVATQVEEGEQVMDMFAGVGPFAIPFALRGATVVGVDLNPLAIEYFDANARRNGVADRLTAIHADVREIAPEYEDWADRIVMNLPHRADEFLEAAYTMAAETCTIHYYDIQPDEDPFGPGERAIRGAAPSEYAVTIRDRRIVKSYAPHEVNVCLDVELDAR